MYTEDPTYLHIGYLHIPLICIKFSVPEFFPLYLYILSPFIGMVLGKNPAYMHIKILKIDLLHVILFNPNHKSVFLTVGFKQ